jgi:hypothetical protein
MIVSLVMLAFNDNAVASRPAPDFPMDKNDPAPDMETTIRHCLSLFSA